MLDIHTHRRTEQSLSKHRKIPFSREQFATEEVVPKIWQFYPFWVGFWPILALLGPNFEITNNLECKKLNINGLSGVENWGIGTIV